MCIRDRRLIGSKYSNGFVGVPRAVEHSEGSLDFHPARPLAGGSALSCTPTPMAATRSAGGRAAGAFRWVHG
eukprot:1822001-Alexandrium_andersonii.AAC.1